MIKAWNLTQDIVISWLSFLPMVFFFVGWGIFMSRREIRDLRQTIANLRASAS
jgi:hypothetical protein